MNASSHITLVKHIHKDQVFWFCHFSRRRDWLDQIKKISGVKYSRTKGKWYLPYTKRSLLSLDEINIPYQLADSTHGTTDKSKSPGASTIIATRSESVVLTQNDNTRDTDISINNDRNIRDRSNRDRIIKKGILKEEGRQEEPTEERQIGKGTSIPKIEPMISWSSKGFVIKINYKADEVIFLRSLKKAFWHSKQKSWIAAGTLHNLRAIQERYSCFDTTKYETLEKLIGESTQPKVVKMYSMPMYPKSVMVKINGYQANLAIIKSIPQREYDPVTKVWRVPNHQEIINQVILRYTEIGYKIINKLKQAGKNYEPKIRLKMDVGRYIRKCEQVYRPTVTRLAEVLLRESYSISTFRSYSSCLILLMKAHKVSSPTDIDLPTINKYLSVLAAKGVSDSQLNMMHSALKIWFAKVEMTPDVVLENLRRPRKAHHLPNILSIGEVKRMLEGSTNVKHIAILYTLYGSGLRLNEVLNVRISDVHWEREQILVRQGKGKKDRMVMMSAPLKEVLTKYFHIYTPEYWLYEGETKGKQYSASSVNKVVKKAAAKANVNKRVTPHTLRHCFATHLMDSGIDTRFIQTLLGHKDIKTTMIYTHVTTYNLNKIKSPLDSMND